MQPSNWENRVWCEQIHVRLSRLRGLLVLPNDILVWAAIPPSTALEYSYICTKKPFSFRPQLSDFTVPFRLFLPFHLSTKAFLFTPIKACLSWSLLNYITWYRTHSLLQQFSFKPRRDIYTSKSVWVDWLLLFICVTTLKNIQSYTSSL